MSRRLLLIEHGYQSTPSLFPVLSSGFACERQTWDSFRPERLCSAQADLVLAVAPPEPSHCLNLLDWLVTHPLPIATMAVLPGDPSEHLLRLAWQTADDFVISPVRDKELGCRLNRILGEHADGMETGYGKRKQELGLAQLVGDDPVFQDVIERIPMVAANDAPVLLLGETGTGKELCAQAIHRLSARSSGPFVPIECGAIPENLIENELFGHVRGAFTDAHMDQGGLVGMAEGGTLFLDEVDTLPLAAQAKLLRFLQEGSYRPLGSPKFLRANIRLIAASNRDLGTCIRAGQFRSDLYFRLNVLPLRLPALRERPRDIAILAEHFLSSICRLAARPQPSFAPSTLRTLQAYQWPGNVRELFNAVQRAVAFSAGKLILPSHLQLGAQLAEADATTFHFQEARSRVIGNFEQHYIEDMLRKHEGNVTRAAREAGKDRRVFGRLMKKYQVARGAA
jgi:two-component system response regulator GlrR